MECDFATQADAYRQFATQRHTVVAAQ
jgi:hypothetical protein